MIYRRSIANDVLLVAHPESTLGIAHRVTVTGHRHSCPQPCDRSQSRVDGRRSRPREQRCRYRPDPRPARLAGSTTIERNLHGHTSASTPDGGSGDCRNGECLRHRGNRGGGRTGRSRDHGPGGRGPERGLHERGRRLIDPVARGIGGDLPGLRRRRGRRVRRLRRGGRELLPHPRLERPLRRRRQRLRRRHRRRRARHRDRAAFDRCRDARVRRLPLLGLLGPSRAAAAAQGVGGHDDRRARRRDVRLHRRHPQPHGRRRRRCRHGSDREREFRPAARRDGVAGIRAALRRRFAGCAGRARRRREDRDPLHQPRARQLRLPREQSRHVRHRSGHRRRAAHRLRRVRVVLLRVLARNAGEPHEPAGRCRRDLRQGRDRRRDLVGVHARRRRRVPQQHPHRVRPVLHVGAGPGSRGARCHRSGREGRGCRSRRLLLGAGVAPRRSAGGDRAEPAAVGGIRIGLGLVSRRRLQRRRGGELRRVRLGQPGDVRLRGPTAGVAAGMGLRALRHRRPARCRHRRLSGDHRRRWRVVVAPRDGRRVVHRRHDRAAGCGLAGAGVVVRRRGHLRGAGHDGCGPRGDADGDRSRRRRRRAESPREPRVRRRRRSVDGNGHGLHDQRDRRPVRG